MIVSSKRYQDYLKRKKYLEWRSICRDHNIGRRLKLEDRKEKWCLKCERPTGTRSKYCSACFQDQVQFLRVKGMNSFDMARLLGYTKSTVNVYLRKAREKNVS